MSKKDYRPAYLALRFVTFISGFHLENCPSGGNWSNLDFKGLGGGGMMVNDVTKFHKHHLGCQGMLQCVCVVGFMQDFEFWEEGNSKVRC